MKGISGNNTIQGIVSFEKLVNRKILKNKNCIYFLLVKRKFGSNS